MSNKTKQEWESEMLECLEDAQRRVLRTSGPERQAALENYRMVLQQFTSLILTGRIPPENPCYS
jgi:hypothetical protein